LAKLPWPLSGYIISPKTIKKEYQIDNRIAWLTLDENDNDLVRFLTYFIAALNQVEGIDANLGKEALRILVERTGVIDLTRYLASALNPTDST